MRRLLSAIVFLIAGLQVVRAQSTTATLSGSVTDSTGASVPGAAVSATNLATGMKSTATSNNEGAFTITLLPPGKYTVLAEHAGFAAEHINDVVLEVGARVALQIRMNPGQVQESVTVTADAAQLQLKTESGERSQVITNKQVLDLALNGRNVLDLMKTLPGVVSNPANVGRGADTRVCSAQTLLGAFCGLIPGRKSAEMSLGAADKSVRATSEHSVRSKGDFLVSRVARTRPPAMRGSSKSVHGSYCAATHSHRPRRCIGRDLVTATSPARRKSRLRTSPSRRNR